MAGPLTAEMICEAEAHCPCALAHPARWAWLAERLNDTLAPGANHRLRETVDEIDLEIMGVMQ